MTEYAGPFLIYPIFYFQPTLIYGDFNKETITSSNCVATIALICHCLHYAKRLYETQFVHRFSNGTMPRKNLFKVFFLFNLIYKFLTIICKLNKGLQIPFMYF